MTKPSGIELLFARVFSFLFWKIPAFVAENILNVILYHRLEISRLVSRSPKVVFHTILNKHFLGHFIVSGIHLVSMGSYGFYGAFIWEPVLQCT